PVRLVAARADGGTEQRDGEAALAGVAARAPLLHGHHLEIVLGDPAIGAGPGVRDVLPARARGDALLGQALGLVVGESADHAHPGAVRRLARGFAHARMIMPPWMPTPCHAGCTCSRPTSPTPPRSWNGWRRCCRSPPGCSTATSARMPRGASGRRRLCARCAPMPACRCW